MLLHRTILVASAVFTTVLRVAAAGGGGGRLECNPTTVTTTANSRSATCTFVVDGDAEQGGSMLGMPSFSFAGVDNDDEQLLVYTKTIATERTLNNDGGHDVTWRGSSAVGFATLVQMPSGGIAGSFRTRASAFMITPHEDAAAAGSLLVRVQETYWVNAMESGTDDAATGEEDGGDGMAVALGGHSGKALSSAMTVVLPQGEETTVSEGEGTRISTPNAIRNIRGSNNNNRRDLESITTINVLVLVTKCAMCESANRSPSCTVTDSTRAPIESALRLVEAETTAGMQDVGVHAAVRFVQITYLEDGSDKYPSLKTLEDLRTDSEVERWRNDANADLVALVTCDDPKGRAGGIAYIERPESVTSWSQFQFYAMVRMCFVVFPHFVCCVLFSQSVSMAANTYLLTYLLTQTHLFFLLLA